jgi:hypothetical protein
MSERTILEWPQTGYSYAWNETDRWSYNTIAIHDVIWFELFYSPFKQTMPDPTVFNLVDTDEIDHGRRVLIARRRTVIEVRQLAQRIQDQIDGVAPDESIAKLERRLDELELSIANAAQKIKESLREANH